MKNLTHITDSMSTDCMLAKGHITSKEGSRVGPPFLQQSFKGKDNFNTSTCNNPRFEPPKKNI
jgi:hypothetical protein